MPTGGAGTLIYLRARNSGDTILNSPRVLITTRGSLIGGDLGPMNRGEAPLLQSYPHTYVNVTY